MIILDCHSTSCFAMTKQKNVKNKKFEGKNRG